MTRKYQDKINELLAEEYSYITKLSLLYEINCQLDMECEDDLIEQIYRAYIDNGNFVCPCAYVNAIKEWCLKNETDFDLIEDYRKMLNEIR